MKLKKVFYIGYYSIDNKQKRNHSPAASGMMEYVLSKISNNFCVTLVSPSWVEGKGGYYSGRDFVTDRIRKVDFFSFGSCGLIYGILSKLYSQIALLIFILLNVKKSDVVIFYHSPTLLIPIYISKKLKRYKCILQVCEIYSDVDYPINNKNYIEKLCISCSDKFILSTECIMDHKFFKNIKIKEYCVCHGDYRIKNFNTPIDIKNPTEITVVYTGIVDKIKKGALNAVLSAKYLSSDINIYILGFGSEVDIQELKYIINKHNDNNIGAKVFFKEPLFGMEYDEFLQKCQIGLATQSGNNALNASSFPAKILSYISNGLRVVSGEVLSVKRSDLSSCIYFYSEDEPFSVAKAILRARGEMLMGKYIETKSILAHLDSKFEKCLRGLIVN